MDGGHVDTEVLLAMLSSLLYPHEHEEAVLLDALVNSQGDVEAAAKSLRSRPPRKRRKVSGRTSIDAWLRKDASQSEASTSPRRAVQSSTAVATHERSPASSSAEGQTPSGPSTKPVSRVKQVTSSELMALLRPPNSSDGSPAKPQVPRLPPLTLSTPEMVAEHTPCTLHHSVLPPELACRLYYTLLYASRDWRRTKWWLADRIVQSSHSTSFFVRATDRKESEGELTAAAQFWYNGMKTDPPPVFPGPMEEACQIVEKVVNAEMRKRRRFPLEWGGYPAEDGEEPLLWRANVAASNCYAGGKESLGFHSDQLTCLGPYPTIASMSLGVGRIFRLREVVPLDERDKRAARTYNIPLRHNSLVIMHASTQEVYKHAVPPQPNIDMFHPPYPPPASLTDDQDVLARLEEASNVRINVTFRFYRPDYSSSSTPRCKCGVPCILRPDMKNRYEDLTAASKCDEGGENEIGCGSGSKAAKKTIVAKYWWTCYAGVQNDGKGCGYWKVMDVKAEGRGPFVGDVSTMLQAQS
ncbi:hypothetical protein C8Q77DRAFT_1094746 [Trametes polyzona]|nr:hypothetical protein C8Q77DRAFT_1094746 [Trametes polyzona]